MTASSATPPARLRLADLEQRPEDEHCELIDGELFVNPAPATKHQLVAASLFLALAAAYRSTGRGVVLFAPVDVVFDDENVVQPDLVYVSKARAGIILPKHIRGAPDLVVEILSDATRRRDVGVKRRLYERFGVARYWTVDPVTDRIETYELAAGVYGPPVVHERTATFEIDGVTLDLDAVFA
jgi:Uma2 family endonuclease